jgi:hypothetical protein
LLFLHLSAAELLELMKRLVRKTGNSWRAMSGP